MASQTTKIIDVTRSYIPVDPQAFPENLNIFTKEDGQEKPSAIVPFEGYNFMPTSYGYKSYFGVTSKLDIDALTSRVDKILVLQTSQFVNIAVALCEDGIWTRRANSTGEWTHEIVLALPAIGKHYEWSYCFLDNDFFAYRANGTAYYKFSNLPRVVTAGEVESALPTVLDPTTVHPAGKFYAVVPNFLNMLGQEGIFKAGSRLGFWDSANSIAWSSIDDYADFTPAVLTMAGSAIFNEVQGRITNILAMGDGFVVYSTKSITVIARDDTGTMQWNPYVALKDAGIAFRRECCIGNTPTSQYAYTQVGLVKVEGPKAATIVDELGDFLKESAQPVYLTLIDQRYLFLEILDGDYLDSLVTFTIETIPSANYPFPLRNINNEYATEYVNGIFDGTNTELQALIDQYIADNALTPRGALANYTPVVDAVMQDQKVVGDTVVMGREMFNFTSTNPASPYYSGSYPAFIGPAATSTDMFVSEGNQGIVYYTDGVVVAPFRVPPTPTNVGKLAAIYSAWLPQGSPNNSGAVPFTDITTLYQAQLNKWIENDNALFNTISQVLLYSDEKVTYNFPTRYLEKVNAVEQFPLDPYCASLPVPAG